MYIQGYDVWISRPDGSDARRLTRDGTADEPWFSPSEDDAGHVVAAHGSGTSTELVRMDQAGRVLQRFEPPVPSLAVGFARVSPDGQRVAYGAMSAYTDCSFTPCHTLFDHSVEYTKATQSTAVSTAQADVDFASWASNDRTILATTARNEVRYHDLASGSAQVWFDDCVNYQDGCNDTDVSHFTPAVSRQGDRYASVVEAAPWSGDAQEYLVLQPTAGAATDDPPATPHDGCAFGPWPLAARDPAPEDHLAYMPSWSPDGRSLVVALRDPDTGWAVYLVDAADLGDCTTVTGGAVLDGASQPFWSPAALTDAGSDQGSGAQLAWAGGPVDLRGRPVPGHRLRPSLRAAQLEQGFSPAAAHVSYTWLRDGHRVRGATGATYRITRKDRHHRLAVRVTGTRPGSMPGTVVSRVVRVR